MYMIVLVNQLKSSFSQCIMYTVKKKVHETTYNVHVLRVIPLNLVKTAERSENIDRHLSGG